MLQGNYIEINGMSQYYEDIGSGPPLILLHSGSSTHEEWNNFIPGLEKDFHLFLPDARGHGRSDNPAGTLFYAQMADDLVSFCYSLSLDKPFIAGWSDGGQVTLDLVIRYPELAQAVVIGGTTWHWTEHSREMIHSMGILGPGIVDFKKLESTLPEMVDSWQTSHGSIYGPEYWRDLLIQNSHLWFLPLGYDEETLKKITDPVMIICGDRSDVMTPAQAVEMHQLIPESELAILPGADHFVAEERPDIILMLMTDFFNRHHLKE